MIEQKGRQKHFTWSEDLCSCRFLICKALTCWPTGNRKFFSYSFFYFLTYTFPWWPDDSFFLLVQSMEVFVFCVSLNVDNILSSASFILQSLCVIFYQRVTGIYLEKLLVTMKMGEGTEKCALTLGGFIPETLHVIYIHNQLLEWKAILLCD